MLTKFITTGFYSGLSPKASGTCGSAVAAVLAFSLYSSVPFLNSLSSQIIVALILVSFAIFTTDKYLEQQYIKESHADPKEVVIDEFAGYFTAIISVSLTWQSYLLAFFIFRFFDIWKPEPTRTLERLPGAYGVVLDDVMAGIYTLLVMKVIEQYVLRG